MAVDDLLNILPGTRKLACSKNPDGCERCKRENIVCHYSEQKPMGRPRKRQHIDTSEEPSNNESLNLELPPYALEHYDGYHDGAVAEPYDTNGLPLPNGGVNSTASSATTLNVLWHFGGPPINFGEMGVDAAGNPIPALDPVQPLSMNSNTSVTDSENSSNPPGPCSCLASMYLALASLQQLPTDIVSALSTVRGAARTAAESIWCPQCGSVALDNPNPPIEAFQNTMLLGTILPIIANGYQKLLKMIDDETEMATAAGQTKTFRFNDYGGMCGKTESIEQAITCFEKTMFFESVEMPPQQWRTTVRALLRVDIYGHEQPGFKHKGLRDLVADMEYRQKTRHELLDAHSLAGGFVGTMGQGANGDKLCVGEKSHTCLQILGMAKFAIDSLVIA